MASKDECGRTDILLATADARLALGDRTGAERSFQTVLERDPTHPEALRRLGNLRRDGGDTRSAIRLLSRSLSVRPGDAYTLNDLGRAYRCAGMPGLAYLSLSAAAEKVPDDVRFRVDLGATLLELHKYPEAADTLYQTVCRDPACSEAHHLLGSTLYRLHLSGAIEDAIHRARTWLAACPDAPLPRHSLAALTGKPPPAASAEWIRATFDRFGPSFDTHLGSLAYGIPDRFGQLARNGCEQRANARVLDLGCGTGLCGERLRLQAQHLVGVDLSSGMLAQARAKGIYDQLVECDIVAFLDEAEETWDLITAADVFIYVGDLMPVLRGVAARLRPAGQFVFSVEAAGRELGELGYELHASGRYRHGETHVRHAVSLHGLTVDHVEEVAIRMERGAPVPGRIFVVAKPEPPPLPAVC